MQTILSVIQIIASVALVIAILFQQRGGGGSAIFGGGGGNYYTKRGFEKILFVLTVIFACLFIIVSFISLLI